MSSSLGDVLQKRQFNEPPEVQIIKRFIDERFDANASVTVQQRQIVIGVHGSSLAGALRMCLHELQELCGTEKRLIIRIY